MARRTKFDIDGDGKADILWHHEISLTGTIVYDHIAYWSATQQGYAWNYLSYIDPSWETWSEYSGDFANNDASSDLLFINYSSRQVGFWDMNAGQFEQWVSLGTFGEGWDVNSIADFSGDGTDDILFGRFVDANQSFEWGYWDIDNGVVSSWNSLGSSSSDWAIRDTGDFTGDGRADIFWHNSSSGGAGIWEMGPNGSVTWVSLGVVDSAWTPVDEPSQDMNGDGNVDIVWFRNQFSNSGEPQQIGFWDVDSGAAQWTLIGTVPSGWYLSALGDYTGDGAADVLLANSSTGDVGFWDMDAGGIYGGWVYVGRDAPIDDWHAF